MALCKSLVRSWSWRRVSCIKTTSRYHSSDGTQTAVTQKEDIKDEYDIIIAGGGMVGCTLACALAKNPMLSNLKVLLLEGSPKQTFSLKPTYSNRVVALNHNTKNLMSSINVWEKIEGMRLQPVHSMQVWDACSNALITFDNSDINSDVAYIVENDVLLHAVNTELESVRSNIDIVYGAKIAGYKLPSPSPSVSQNISTVLMENKDAYTCRLLIGADGANSKVRDCMGVQYVSWSYEQMGVVATLHLAEAQSSNNTAWQRFLPSGPVALLPLGAGLSSLVWSTSVPHAKQLLALHDDQFVDTLNDALWKEYPRSSSVDSVLSSVSGALRAAGLPDGSVRQLPPSVARVEPASRAAFPLAFGHSTRYVAPGVALVGDAAHRVHPLAGQGVNLGFGDVRELVRLLAETAAKGEDIGSTAWMSEYETTRQRHNVPTQLAIEALHRLYTLDLTPVHLVRGVGLQLTHALAPLKKLIMSHATA